MVQSSNNGKANEGEAYDNDKLPSDEPFNSEIHIRGDSHLISHDPHLNEDGDALHRFLLEQAAFPPSFLLSCSGTHQETRTRQAQVPNGQGGTRSQTETYPVTITDFAFTINLTQCIISEPLGPPIYIAGDRSAISRGKTHLEVDEAPTKGADGKDLEMSQIQLGKQFRRKATSEEKDAADTRAHRLELVGLPPWVHLPGEPLGTQATVDSDEARHRFQYSVHGVDQTFDDSGLQVPGENLRQWADEYCRSKKMLKEFNFHKIVYGWNLAELREEIARMIKLHWSHGGSHQPDIKFTLESDVVSVRPDNWLSRILSRRLVKFLLWVLLIYPLVIWPYKRFGSGGGGEWRVAGSAYAMAKWVHLEDSVPGETVESYSQRVPPIPSLRTLRATPKGISRLEGTREGEWFREWEGTIASFVREKRINRTPVTMPSNQPGAVLDGYRG
ncbi:hypothetical protein FRB98_003855 [Tulasnella sp. 332]|nr:hypothetical protein FRB98_003855 [Tulasnella sp. 332]